MLTKRATAYNTSSPRIVLLIYRHLFRLNSLSKCAPKPKIAAMITITTILMAHNRLSSSVSRSLESLSSIPVTASNKYMSICNRFARRANSGKIDFLVDTAYRRPRVQISLNLKGRGLDC